MTGTPSDRFPARDGAKYAGRRSTLLTSLTIVMSTTGFAASSAAYAISRCAEWTVGRCRLYRLTWSTGGSARTAGSLAWYRLSRRRDPKASVGDRVLCVVTVGSFG